MCTALSIKSDEGKYFFGRNMDLLIPLIKQS